MTSKDKSTTIFTIERRRDFSEAFSNFFEDLQSEVTTSAGERYKMFAYLNHCIRYWPYRCGATGIDDYLKGIDVDITAPKGDGDLLLTLELFVNLIHWAPIQDINDRDIFYIELSIKKNNVENEAERFIKNIEYILEQCCNMAIREDDKEDVPRYYITKRNSYVDMAVIAVPEIKEVLLGYLDIRNSEDVDYKKGALTTIYSYMEPHRKEYKSLVCSSVSEEFFTSMNTFGIRHNTKSQIRIRTKKKIEICNKLYMMAIYVLQSKEINKYKNDLKTIRENS